VLREATHLRAWSCSDCSALAAIGARSGVDLRCSAILARYRKGGLASPPTCIASRATVAVRTAAPRENFNRAAVGILPGLFRYGSGQSWLSSGSTRALERLKCSPLREDAFNGGVALICWRPHCTGDGPNVYADWQIGNL
jgi:hypothetical protein